MRIDDVNRAGGIQPTKRTNPYKTENTEVKRSSNRDEVQISSEAQALMNAQAQGVGATDERLAELKKAIMNGTYQVDAEELAERILPYL